VYSIVAYILLAHPVYMCTPYLFCCCVLQICDFGLAKWKQEAATQTTTGTRRGTVVYMAPEVFKDVNTPRTVKYDVYSFGILLWELLAGKRPFEHGKDILSFESDVYEDI